MGVSWRLRLHQNSTPNHRNTRRNVYKKFLWFIIGLWENHFFHNPSEDYFWLYLSSSRTEKQYFPRWFPLRRAIHKKAVHSILSRWYPKSSSKGYTMKFSLCASLFFLNRCYLNVYQIHLFSPTFSLSSIISFLSKVTPSDSSS